MSANRIHSLLASIFLVLCIVLGGANAPSAGVPANFLLQILSVFLILFSVFTRGSAPYAGGSRPLVLIGGLWLLLGLLYLIPLPHGLWTSLPGREPIARGLESLGAGQPALAVSLSPDRSIGALLGLLPPTALFLLTLQLTQSQRRRLATVFIAAAAVGACLGAAQIAGGPQSPFRLYSITNPNMAVGFFANGNHQATLLLCALALTGFLVSRAAQKHGASKRKGAALAAPTMIAVFLATGVAIVGSVAGYGLLLFVVAGVLLMHRRAASGRIGRKWAIGTGVLFVAMVGLALTGPFAERAVSDQLGEDQHSRRVIAETTLQAAQANFPTGSGLGSFVDVYRTFEDPLVPAFEYVNHAHSDFLELALETGLPGLLLVLAFLIWFGREAVRAWQSNREGANLARAATLIILVVLMHSLVDYPIRASAIAATFATACAFLLPPRLRPRSSKSQADEETQLRHMEAD